MMSEWDNEQQKLDTHSAVLHQSVHSSSLESKRTLPHFSKRWNEELKHTMVKRSIGGMFIDEDIGKVN